MKMVKCRICGKEFKQITYDHLKCKHGMSLDEYREMYPDDNICPNRNKNTKGIWDEKLGKYKYVKHPDRPKIKCQLCNNEFYRISDIHMQRKHQIDLQDYKDMFPDEPLFITTDAEKILISKNHADVSGENNPMYGVSHPPELMCQIVKSYKETLKKKHESNEWLNIGCSWCGERFHRSPYHINNINFCSKKCQSKWYSKNRKGTKNANWRGGISKKGYPIYWPKMRKLALEYWGKICYICGSKDNICVHHIDYDKTNCHVNNLIPLCNKCHLKTNNYRAIWYRLFCCGDILYMNDKVNQFVNKHF